MWSSRHGWHFVVTWPVKILIGYDRVFCATGRKLMTAEQSTFMIDLHQVGMMLRYIYQKLRENNVPETWSSFVFISFYLDVSTGIPNKYCLIIYVVG